MLQESYANSHAEDSYTGKATTGQLHQAETRIKEMLRAEADDYVIPVGTVSTGAIQKLAEILAVYCPPALRNHLDGIMPHYSDKAPVVFVGPYEHYSKDLIWRESIAETVMIRMDSDGAIDLDDLRSKLALPEYSGRLKVGSFSAASNVTGRLSPVYEIAEILHANNAFACFDFAASGPYVKTDMNHSDTAYFDAIDLSPHKFLGGPGSSGITECVHSYTITGSLNSPRPLL